MKSNVKSASRTILKWSIVVLTSCLLTGCVGLVVLGAQEVAGIGRGDDARLAKIVVDGTTSRQELIQHLGEPIHQLNDGKVLIFGGRQRARSLLQLVKDDKRDEHRLIAILDADGVLREHLWVGRKADKANVQPQPVPL